MYERIKIPPPQSGENQTHIIAFPKAGEMSSVFHISKTNPFGEVQYGLGISMQAYGPQQLSPCESAGHISPDTVWNEPIWRSETMNCRSKLLQFRRHAHVCTTPEGCAIVRVEPGPRRRTPKPCHPEYRGRGIMNASSACVRSVLVWTPSGRLQHPPVHSICRIVATNRFLVGREVPHRSLQVVP